MQPTDDWPAEKVKSALKEHGTTFAEIASRAGFRGRTSVYNVFRSASPLVEKAIADALGLKPQQIWPSRYESDGLPKGLRRFRTVVAAKATPGNVKTARRA